MKNFKIPLSLFILLFVSSVCFGQTTKKITTYHDYWKLYPYEVYYVKADQPGFKHGKYKKYYSSGGIRMETNMLMTNKKVNVLGMIEERVKYI
ncbi:MAG: hypothetical protein JKX95_08265 [Bacteroidia bacterium]|nr:hypothetical protein [Bacteroidia bacterium]